MHLVACVCVHYKTTQCHTVAAPKICVWINREMFNVRHPTHQEKWGNNKMKLRRKQHSVHWNHLYLTVGHAIWNTITIDIDCYWWRRGRANGMVRRHICVNGYFSPQFSIKLFAIVIVHMKNVLHDCSFGLAVCWSNAFESIWKYRLSRIARKGPKFDRRSEKNSYKSKMCVQFHRKGGERQYGLTVAFFLSVNISESTFRCDFTFQNCTKSNK